MRIAIAAAVTCLSIIGMTATAQVHASVRKHTEIPAESLDLALRTLAKDRGFQLVYLTENVASLQTRGVSGEFTDDEALKKLLSDSRLEYKFVDANTVSIFPKSNTTSSLSEDRARSTAMSMGQDGLRAIRLAQIADQQSQVSSSENTPTSQNSSNSYTGAAEEGTGTKLEEIIVTAQRREQNANSVPISLTAFSSKGIEEYNLQSFNDLAGVVPGLVMTSVGGDSQASTDIAIRGIISNGNSPTTGIYIDETSIATRRIDVAGYSGSPQPDIFDLDRIEVLRGPQGTLFGAGAMGGAIRYITPKPNLEEAGGSVKAEFGGIDHGGLDYSVGAVYGTPIIRDELGFRISGSFRSEGGFDDRENPYTNQVTSNSNAGHSYVVRPALTWVPIDGLTITPAMYLEYRHTDDPNTFWASPHLSDDSPSKHVLGAAISSPFSDEVRIYSTSIKYSTGSLEFLSDTSYLQRKSRNTDDWTGLLPAFFGISLYSIPSLFNTSYYDVDYSTTQAFQQEFRVQSADPDSRLNWVTGLYLNRERTEVSQLISNGDPIGLALYGAPLATVFGSPNYDLNGQSWLFYGSFQTVDVQTALFGELTFAITPRLKANIGVRAEHSVVEDQRQVLVGPLSGGGSDLVAPDQKENPVTPRAGLTYQLADQTIVYATAAKGYRSGGSNPAAVTENPTCQQTIQSLGGVVKTSYNSDHLWSYELGVKWAANPRVSVQASVFYVDWTNIQNGVSLCGNPVTFNQGKAISQGADLQVAVAPISGLQLSANAGYTNTYYPSEFSTFPALGTPQILHVAGEKVQLIPPWTAALHAEYSHPVWLFGDASRLYGRADYRWTDRLINDDPHDLGYNPATGPTLSDAYGLLDLRAGIRFAGFDVSAYVENMTNSDPTLQLRNRSGTDFNTAIAITPRTAGITLLYKF